MEKFIIKKIEADFDERWLRVKKIDDGKEFGIYFMEFSEDVFMMNNISMKNAKNSIVDRDIILDMEKDMDLKKGDRIYIEGSLQIELEEYKKRLGLLEDWKR